MCVCVCVCVCEFVIFLTVFQFLFSSLPFAVIFGQLANANGAIEKAGVRRFVRILQEVRVCVCVCVCV